MTGHEKDARIGLITLGGEGDSRFLNRHAYCDLAEQLQDAAADEMIRAIVLLGRDGCFCLGGDLGEMSDSGEHLPLLAAVSDLFTSLATFPKPIIAAVDGEAIGVGCTMLYHCDLVLATQRSAFRVPFVDFGLVPDAATSILAPERMGYAAAFRFFCLGEPLDAAAAAQVGIVSRLVRSDEVVAEAKDTAMRLARKPGNALRQTRELLRGDRSRLCHQIGRELSLFHDALKDEHTVRRLRKLARYAA